VTLLWAMSMVSLVVKVSDWKTAVVDWNENTPSRMELVRLTLPPITAIPPERVLLSNETSALSRMMMLADMMQPDSTISWPLPSTMMLSA
jgi:hypothetical protein